ncbi:MAG: IgGFc-binding protein, partial [Candidatus Kapaibacterium sp.]
MPRTTVIHCFCLVFFLWWSTPAAVAQNDSLPDSRGKDFWFCFPPNFHNDGIDNPDAQRRDSLYVFVASEKPTDVTIEYRDSAGTLFSKRFRINDPKQMLSFGEKFYPFELMGFNRCGDRLDLSAGQNLRVAKQYFHVKSDEDVTVYAMSQALTTSDAFLVLPTDALSNQYYVMSYTADPSSQASAGTPSQFAIVATEDSTEVRIETDEPIYRYGRVPGVVRLNAGDVYLVQSQVGDSRRLVDLTGTYVESTKPIALFSGHQRATIPIEDDRRSSRDCLIEQMTPISTWGRGALLVPYPEPSDAMVFTGDKYRILAAYDSTEVYIDSVFVTTLDAGSFYEGELR